MDHSKQSCALRCPYYGGFKCAHACIGDATMHGVPLKLKNVAGLWGGVLFMHCILLYMCLQLEFQGACMQYVYNIILCRLTFSLKPDHYARDKVVSVSPNLYRESDVPVYFYPIYTYVYCMY